MRFFEFETYLTSDEIQHRMSSYYEWEKHSSWNIFKEYTSPRKGLHLYPDENGFTVITKPENVIDITICRERKLGCTSK